MDRLGNRKRLQVRTDLSPEAYASLTWHARKSGQSAAQMTRDILETLARRWPKPPPGFYVGGKSPEKS